MSMPLFQLLLLLLLAVCVYLLQLRQMSLVTAHHQNEVMVGQSHI